jgi:hypothetical protein
LFIFFLFYLSSLLQLFWVGTNLVLLAIVNYNDQSFGFLQKLVQPQQDDNKGEEIVVEENKSTEKHQEV